jgi:hypothetical protein
MLERNSDVVGAFECEQSKSSSGVLSGLEELWDSDGDSTKGALCFLEWKKGMIMVEQFENVSQLAFLEAVTAFLSSILLIAYFSCKQFGLLF